MRKSLLLSLLVFLLAALCLLTVGASEKVVFVSSGATGTGASAEDPVGTLAAAYTALGDEGGTLVLMNEYVLGAKVDLPAHTGTIKWTSVYGGVDYRENGAALKWTTSVRLALGGPTEIDGFVFKDTSPQGGVLAANFHDLTIGTAVQTVNGSGIAAKTIALICGPNNDTTIPALGEGKTCTITVNGGSYNYIVAFSRMVPNITHAGTVTLNVGENASMTTCYLGANANNAKGGNTILNISGNASITGTLYLSGFNNNTPIATNGSVTVNATGSASITNLLGYLATYFPNGTRTLNYEETVTLPAGLTTPTHFNTITVIEPPVEPDEPEEPEIPEEPTVLDVVFVAEGASGNGASAETPVGNLADAYALLGEDGGEIILVGDTTVTSDLALADLAGDVTFKAQDGAALILSAALSLQKNTNAYTVSFDLPITATDAVIYGGFNNVTFGENCAITGSLDFYGGVLSFNDETTSDTAVITELPYTVTVKSGTFRNFVGGNLRASYEDMIGAIAAPLTVNISGGSFTDSFNLSGDSFLSDNVTLTISGGSFACPLYVRSVSTYNQAKATRYSPTVTADRKYYAMDGDITINIAGGSFNGGLVSAYDTSVAYTQLLRGRYTVTVTGGTFAEGTVFDATQVKAYAGDTDNLASITYPDTYDFTVIRYDSVNGVAQEYDEPLRVAFVGDSITEGVGSGAPLTKSYPAVFADLAKADTPDIIVANYGVAGATALPDTSIYYLDRLGWPVLTEETDADYIVLALGTNDNTAGGVNATRVAFETSYTNIIETLGALPCTEKLFITNAIARGTDVTTTAQIRVASVVRPLQERIANAFAAKDPDKFIFVDLYGLTVHSAAEGPLLGGDDLHPNAKGYEAMADAIYGAIFNGVTVPETDYRHGDVYLSANGKPYASGTKDDRTSSFAHAMALMPLDGEGTLHISGTISCAAYTSTSSLPKHLTIVGEGEDAVLEITDGGTFKLLSAVKFDNITLKTTVADMYLIAGYNSAEFTDSVTFKGNWSFVAGLYVAGNDTVATCSSANNCTFTLNCNAAFNHFLPGNCRFAGTAPFGTYSGDMTVVVGDNVTFSGNAGAVGQNYLTGSVAVSLPHGASLAEYASIGADTNTIYDAANNTGTVTISKREAVAKPEVVYFSAGAAGTGLSADSPIGTLASAYAKLGEDGGTLVWMSEFSASAATELPAHTGTVTITSVYNGVDYRESGAALKYTAAIRVAFNGPTVVENFKIILLGAEHLLCANFHPLTLGEGMVLVDGSGNPKPALIVIGGGNNNLAVGTLDAGETNTITVNSGTYKQIAAFSGYNKNLAHTGTVTLNVGGSVKANSIMMGAKAAGSTGGSTILNLSGNASIGTVFLGNETENAKSAGTVTVNVLDNASIEAFDRYAPTCFATENARTLVHSLTASLPEGDYFDSVTLTDVGYLTINDRALAGLTFAKIGELNVTKYVTEADGAITLPYPEALDTFMLTLEYTVAPLTTVYTYTATVENGVANAVLTNTETFSGGTVVYVRDGSTGSGFTPGSPVGSIAAAHALLPNGGTIVLVGETTLSVKATLPAHTGTMTYTSVYDGVDYRKDGARLYFPNGITVLLGGEAVFKDIAIHTDTYAYITAGFNPLTFDTGVEITHNEEDVAKASDRTYGLRLAGGYNNYSLGEVTDDRNASITLKSGFFRHVHGFSRYTGKTTYTGTANIVVEGTAIVDELITGATQQEATAANVNLTLSDNACIYNVFVGGKEKTNLLTGEFNFVVNGGDIYEIDALILFTAVDCETTFTYDVNTVPAGFPFYAELAQFKTVQTFCERDNAHNYSDPFASEFDASVQLKRCSVCGDIQFVGDLPEAISGNVVFVAEGGLGDGSHPAIPTNDLYAAFEQLKDSGGTIVIMNAYTLKTNTTQKIGGAPAFFQEPLHDGAILVTSVYGETDYRESGAKFVFDGDVDYKLGGPVTFDHIVFDATKDTTKNTIAARYNPIVIGEDVEMLRDMEDSYALDLVGGYLYFRYTDFTDVVIEDGLIEMVNPARPIEINPETGDYTVDDPVNITVNGVTRVLRAEAAAAFEKMFDDLEAAGLQRPTGVAYAWRGYYEQYDGFTKQAGNIRVNYPNYDFDRAYRTVLQSCSLPGGSEHHLGYAFDFHDASYGENAHHQYDKTAEWAWIMQNGHKYGLILRFTPKDTATTGFIYEAWHFRYVGVEHATAIANLNSNGDPVANAEMLKTPEWCLEDYAGLVLGMYDLDSSVTVNGGTFAHIEGGSRYCDDLPLTGEEVVTIGENATVKPTGENYDLVFFSAGAEGDGKTAETPVGTLALAYAKLGEDGGTLVWMSEFSASAATELPAHTGTVTITSVYNGVDYRESGAALKYTANIRVAFNGPTVVENFKIFGFNAGCLLCANFNPLTLGDGMVLVDANGESNPTLTIVGGGNNNLSVGTLDEGETNTLTIKSGIYTQVIAFSAYNTNLSHTGTVYLNIGGNTSLNSIIMGAKAEGSKGGTTVLTLSDNASVGTVFLANGDNKTAVTNGTVTVYAKDSSTISAFNHYRPDLFATENARSIYYEETATLPANLETCFDNISLLDDSSIYNGDANGDGRVTLLDVLRILKAVANEDVTVFQAADINRDGTITILDVLLVLKVVLSK